MKQNEQVSLSSNSLFGLSEQFCRKLGDYPNWPKGNMQSRYDIEVLSEVKEKEFNRISRFHEAA
jgi:hypothetical protein